eukprot:2344515-Prymnesium_polylepis.1
MSESAADGLAGLASCANSETRSAEISSAGSVAMNGPSCWHAAMRTHREPSPSAAAEHADTQTAPLRSARRRLQCGAAATAARGSNSGARQQQRRATATTA